MKTHTRLVSLITLGALLGFMFAAVSCTGLISPSTQAKIDQASTKYQDTTGLSTGQTVSLLGKWWTDLQQAREVNKLLKSEPIPLGPVQATQASPLMDYTSAKAVLEGVHTTYVSPAAPPTENREHPPAPKVRPAPNSPTLRLLASH